MTRFEHGLPFVLTLVCVDLFVAIGFLGPRLAGVVGVESVPYGEIFDEIVRGMFNLHWDQETEAFFDYGEHVSDGELVNEATMRCQKGEI